MLLSFFSGRLMESPSAVRLNRTGPYPSSSTFLIFCGNSLLSAANDLMITFPDVYKRQAGFTLVVLYVDTRDAFQCITYVGVGELAYLVGGHYILDAEAVLLRIDGAALSLKGAAYHNFL